jgi:hypothetical protein
VLLNRRPRGTRVERRLIVLESLKVWLGCVRFAYEVWNVVSMRRVLLRRGGPLAAGPARWTAAQQREAFTDGETAIINALAHGEGLMVAAERADAPVRRWVRASNRRLLDALGSEAG